MRSPTVSTKLQRIAAQAADYPQLVFTTLAHLIDVEFLREAFHRINKRSSPGLDKVTARQYAEDLEENLVDLHERMRSGLYKAPPVVRVWLEKEDGKRRPIGKPTFEDKIVQRAVEMLLSAIYEQVFYDFSHGFRQGRSQHRALHELDKQLWQLNIGWIVNADITGLFDNLDHGHLRRFIRKRVNDGSIIRLIGKWLNAGVMEEGKLKYYETGTPQGGVISPLLSNIFLHYVLDDWFVKEVKPRLRGRCFMIRWADDFIIGCELESDARRIMAVLPKRFGRYGLSLHPEKTSIIRFKRPRSGGGGKDRQNGTIDFLGFTFYWARSYRGYWVMKKKTARRRLARFMRVLWRWCRENMHEPIQQQHRALCVKLRGWFRYHGVRNNYRALKAVFACAGRAWRYWLSRRSSKGTVNWEKFDRLCLSYPLPRPRLIHNI